LKIQLTNDRLEKKNDLVTDFKECYLKAIKVKSWLKNKPAFGIAFNQVGLTESCAVFKKHKTLGLKDSIIFNPEYEPTDESDIVDSEEGCLSYPGKMFKIKRFNKIKVSYYIYDIGDKIKKIVDILHEKQAVVFQHETDHLMGITDSEKGEEIE